MTPLTKIVNSGKGKPFGGDGFFFTIELEVGIAAKYRYSVGNWKHKSGTSRSFLQRDGSWRYQLGSFLLRDGG